VRADVVEEPTQEYGDDSATYRLVNARVSNDKCTCVRSAKLQQAMECGLSEDGVSQPAGDGLVLMVSHGNHLIMYHLRPSISLLCRLAHSHIVLRQ